MVNLITPILYIDFFFNRGVIFTDLVPLFSKSDRVKFLKERGGERLLAFRAILTEILSIKNKVRINCS